MEDAPAPIYQTNTIPDEGISCKNEMKEAINEIENISFNSTKDLIQFANNFKEKNNIFCKEISSKYQFKPNEKSQKYGENIIPSDTENYIHLIKKISEVYSQIYNTIKQNLEIMAKFLEIYKYLDKTQPIQDFLYEEFNSIIDSWLFMKIDFEKFKFNEALNNSNLDENFKNFVTNISKKKKFIMNIINPKHEILEQKEKDKLKEKKISDIKSLTENQKNITKLYMENIGNVSDYIDDKLELIKLNKFYIKNSVIQNENIFKSMQNLEKLCIISCPNNRFDLFGLFPSKLKKLYLEKNNYVDFDFDTIINVIFSNNKNIFQNLESLSFAGNNLTRIDFSELSQKTIFSELTDMNFNKNKIFKFIINPDNFPKLKFINCCNNNFNKSYLSKIDQIQSLESGNWFLLEPSICKEYFSKLKQNLKSNENDKFKTNYLSISYMPKEQSLFYFNDLIINELIITRLKELDLSCNGLNCNIFFKFVNSNQEFVNLRSLDLNGNELDDTFFERFLELNNFNKLEHLNLNSNKIGDMNIKIEYRDQVPIDKKYAKDKDKELVYKLRLIYKFIHKYNCLTKLSITKNPISELYSVIPEPNKNADKSDKYIKRDENNNIIINCLFSLLVKIRDELLDKEREKGGRNYFNLIFDCRSNVNKNSDNYPYSDVPIIYKSK